MKFKPSINTFHVAILFILSCLMVVLALKLRTLSNGSESAPTLASIETLADQQGELRTDLEKLIGSNLITLSRYQADQAELRQKIETLARQSATEKARLQLEQELVALAAEAEQIKGQIAQLQKTLDARPWSCTACASARSEPGWRFSRLGRWPCRHCSAWPLRCSFWVLAG